MTDQDTRLHNALWAGQRRADGSAPNFAKVWAGARKKAKRGRGRSFTGLAVAAAAAVLAFSLLTPTGDDFRYVDMEDLKSSTTWSAPSDALLPERRFDIYQEVPRLFESTESDGGTLL